MCSQPLLDLFPIQIYHLDLTNINRNVLLNEVFIEFYLIA